MAHGNSNCQCGKRMEDDCPGLWEQGCDLGANEQHVQVASSELTEKIEGAIMPDMIDKETIQNILAERGSRYGKFSTHAAITQSLKIVMEQTPKWHELTAAQKEALEMTAHKIGRILNGDPNYVDSWVDIVGYNQLVVNILNGEER